MRLFALLFIVVILIACGGTEDRLESESLNDNLQSDTVHLERDSLIQEKIPIPDEMKGLISLFNDTLVLPLSVDSIFLQNEIEKAENELRSLSYETVKEFTEGGLKNGPAADQSYILKACMEIDSIKRAGGYEEYLQSIDLAMMQDAVFSAIGLIEMGDGKTVLLWIMNYSSYEACPYYTGAVIFGTSLNEYNIQNTIELAEFTSSGDAPAWGMSEAYSEVSMDEILTVYRDAYGETDEVGYNYADDGRLTEHFVRLDSTGFAEISVKE
ncbi:MAG: hypothetical protein ACPG21_02830 [Crocinitomicaceae bacterium]